MTWIQVASLGGFAATFAAIFMERVRRTIVAISAAAIMLLFGVKGFYSQEEAFRAVDFNTILLLWMMLTVVILESSGYLQYAVIHMLQKSKGRQSFAWVAGPGRNPAQDRPECARRIPGCASPSG